MRNLDVTTLRSFVAVADSGGVTRAAGFLHLTQSAVSMQIKRLEEMLGQDLLDRSGRGISLTASGEQLLGYARRMVALNDEVVGRLTDQAFEGEVTLGVPHDVVQPAIPRVLQRFNASFPRVRVHLISSYTRELKSLYGKGECDLILTTESAIGEGGEQIQLLPLRWVGAPDGSMWRQRPLRLAFSRNCIFRPIATAALDQAGIPWDSVVDSESDRTIEATISADLAVGVLLDGTLPPQHVCIDDGGTLPDLPSQNINLYGGLSPKSQLVGELANLLRQVFAAGSGPVLRVAGGQV
ncbi:MAG: LysR family transcriptional regulator [Paracoccaceae bacterium]